MAHSPSTPVSAIRAPSPQRVLVVRLMHHGDVLLTTPVFSALTRHFPGVQVDALVYSETVPMIAANPHLSRIWPMPRSSDAGSGWDRLRALSSLLAAIRHRRYDWVIHLDDRWTGALVALASGATLRASYELSKRNNAIWRRAFPVRVAARNTGHVVERNLWFLRELGLPIDPQDQRCLMAYSDDARALARQKLSAAGINGEYILVHPAARWFFKCWEDERFAEVLLSLANDGHRIVLTSGPNPRELALAARILELAPHPRISSIAGELTLPALAAAIAGARLFIGVDSAPMHMAAALGVPMVALFGPTNVEAWRPWSDAAVLIHAADYGPLIEPRDVDTSTDERYLVNIPVAPVLAAARRQLTPYQRSN
jgi:heptosyltransferase-3